MAEKKYTIHPEGDGYVVCHWHTYPRHSVLAGQSQEVVDDHFDLLGDAVAAYPDADVSEYGRSRHKPSVSACAPSDFSYYDAGEYWGEDDY